MREWFGEAGSVALVLFLAVGRERRRMPTGWRQKNARKLPAGRPAATGKGLPARAAHSEIHTFRWSCIESVTDWLGQDTACTVLLHISTLPRNIGRLPKHSECTHEARVNLFETNAHSFANMTSKLARLLRASVRRQQIFVCRFLFSRPCTARHRSRKKVRILIELNLPDAQSWHRQTEALLDGTRGGLDELHGLFVIEEFERARRSHLEAIPNIGGCSAHEKTRFIQ
jgi:hypothetical protein